MSEKASDPVEKVREVTGCSEAIAKNYLAACNNKVEAAIMLFFEGDGTGSNLDEDTTEFDSNNDINQDHMASSNRPRTVCNGKESDIPPTDEVRAPIKPIREQLLAPEDDNFFATTSSNTGAFSASMHSDSNHLIRNARRIKVCPLRDFAREGAILEQQLQANEDVNPSGVISRFPNTNSAQSANDYSNRASANCHGNCVGTPAVFSNRRLTSGLYPQQEAKRRKLEDLFRPPTDIAYPGTFQAARTRAEALQHWLLVNVQTDNFDSQLLNRDVWSDTALRKILKKHFLLWQVDADTSEGRRFVTFYHCSKLPYLCIIDPRTGEEVWKSAGPTQETVLPDIKNFLKVPRDFGREISELNSNATKNTIDSSLESISDNKSFVNICEHHKSTLRGEKKGVRSKQQLTELTEEEQLALAIRNSIMENGAEHDRENGKHKCFLTESCQDSCASNILKLDSDESEYDTEDDGDASNKEETDNKIVNSEVSHLDAISYEDTLGIYKDEITTLKIRLFNAVGTDQMVQLRWPSDTLLLTLRRYIRQVHPHIPTSGYKLICAFPRTVLDTSFDNKTLKESGLHPSANLHITLDE